MGCCAVGGNEVCYGFSLAEVELGVKESALGEFSGFSNPCSVADEDFENFVQNIAGTVTGELHAVLTGVAAGSGKEGDEGFVDDVAVIKEGGEDGGARRCVRRDAATDLLGDGDGLWTTEADDANGSAWCSGNCADGIHQMRSRTSLMRWSILPL